MELLKKALTALTFVLVISCQPVVNEQAVSKKIKERKISSQDFTPMGLFTEGIEGPAVDSNGRLYVVNYKTQGTIGVIDENGKPSLYLELPEGSIGNSLRFNKKGQLFIADYAGHVIYRYNGSLDTLVYEPKMNQPNDMVIANDGTIYASDPNWSQSSGKLWMVKNGEAVLVEENMGTTNGVALHADGTKLFVNESVQRNVWVYDIDPDGTPVNKQLFRAFHDFGMDGMKFNALRKELFIARYGAGELVSLNEKGDVVRRYQLKGEKPTNLAFSMDLKTCYVTMQARKGVEVVSID